MPANRRPPQQNSSSSSKRTHAHGAPSKQADQQSSSKAAERLRVQQPAALRTFLSTAAPSGRLQLRHLELAEKLPLKLYEELAACILPGSSSSSNSAGIITSNSSSSSSSGCPLLEVLSLAGSCCGDTALLTLLPALTQHPRLVVLDASSCCLSDAAGVRVASLMRAQAGAAAQAAWAKTLRTRDSSSGVSGGKRRSSLEWGAWSTHKEAAAALQLTAAAASRGGLQVLDLSHNQLTAATLSALATALGDEHCCASHVNLSFNSQLPPAQESASVLQAALAADHPQHRVTVELLQTAAPAAAAVAILSSRPAGGVRGAPSAGQLARSSSGAMRRRSASSSGGGGGGRRGAAPVICAPTQAGLQLWSGVFVWEAAQASSSSCVDQQQQEKEVSTAPKQSRQHVSGVHRRQSQQQQQEHTQQGAPEGRAQGQTAASAASAVEQQQLLQELLFGQDSSSSSRSSSSVPEAGQQQQQQEQEEEQPPHVLSPCVALPACDPQACACSLSVGQAQWAGSQGSAAAGVSDVEQQLKVYQRWHTQQRRDGRGGVVVSPGSKHKRSHKLVLPPFPPPPPPAGASAAASSAAAAAAAGGGANNSCLGGAVTAAAAAAATAVDPAVAVVAAEVAEVLAQLSMAQQLLLQQQDQGQQQQEPQAAASKGSSKKAGQSKKGVRSPKKQQQQQQQGQPSPSKKRVGRQGSQRAAAPPHQHHQQLQPLADDHDSSCMTLELLQLAQTMCVLTDAVEQLESLVYHT